MNTISATISYVICRSHKASTAVATITTGLWSHVGGLLISVQFGDSGLMEISQESYIPSPRSAASNPPQEGLSIVPLLLLGRYLYPLAGCDRYKGARGLFWSSEISFFF